MTMSSVNSTFDVRHWCDYARGAVEPGEMAQMDAALASSEAARRSVELFTRVDSFARSEREAEIPEYAVRVAKAVADLGRPSSWEEEMRPARPPSSLLSFLPFKVTFDSRAAAQAGTRDFSSSDHRITSYRAREFSVHVKLEQETSPHSQVMVGQLLHHGPEPRPAPGVPVLVLSRGRVVGRSLTSRFGEFQAADLPPDALQLCLLVGAEECIDLPLGADAEEA